MADLPPIADPPARCVVLRVKVKGESAYQWVLVPHCFGAVFEGPESCTCDAGGSPLAYARAALLALERGGFQGELVEGLRDLINQLAEV